MNILKKFANGLKSYPMKSIFFTLVIVILLAVGVQSVFMATGNDTLVQTNTDVYKDNEMLEQDFGGESVIVLFESDNLLTPEHLEHVKGIETALQLSDSIHSLISPVTLVESIAEKQADHFQEGITEIIDGLNEMGSQLIDIGTELEENIDKQTDIEFPSLGSMEMPPMDGGSLPQTSGQFEQLNEGFSQIMQAQTKLDEGTTGLVSQYTLLGEKTSELGEALAMLTDELQDAQQKEQLLELSTGLNELSMKMAYLTKESEQLTHVSSQAITGIETIQKNLNDQLEDQGRQQMEMQKQQEMAQKQIETELQKQQLAKENQMQQLQEEMEIEQKEQTENLHNLSEGLITMGDQLQTVSENIEEIYNYSDIMVPGLPKKQTTLDQMIYEDGEIRPMFEEVVIDERHMLMMIKFKGDTNDTDKSEVIETITHYLDLESSSTLHAIVSGKPVLDGAIRSSMMENIQKMMGLALLIMIVILTIVFKVQWRLLPLITVLLAVVGTVGLMGWLQIPITMVSMAVFPILIGLGIDYSIQFQNRYAEEMAKEGSHEQESK